MNNSIHDSKYNSITKDDVSKFDDIVIPKRSPVHKIQAKMDPEIDNSLVHSTQEQNTEEMIGEMEAKLP